MRFPGKSCWQSNLLGNICQFYKGNGISKSDLTNHGQNCILYGQLYTTYLNEIITKVECKTAVKLKRPFYSQTNDLIIPSSGEDPIDIAVARSIQVDNVVLGSDLNVLRPNKGFDSSFLSYQLNGKRKFDIAKIAQGKSVVHLHNEHLKKIKVYYPNIEEQVKISALLSKIDQQIHTQSKIIEKYISLIKGIEDRFFWNNVSTANVSIKNFLLERNEKSITQNQYEILSSTKKGLFLQSDYFNKEASSSNNVGYKITHKGDIIISPQNLWMGNITFNDKFDNGLVSPSYHVYKISKDYNPIYISNLLKTYRALYMYKTISEQGASVVRRNLNIESFNELCFPIPNRKKQDEVSLIIRKLDQKLHIENEILNKLKLQKNYLLANLFI